MRRQLLQQFFVVACIAVVCCAAAFGLVFWIQATGERARSDWADFGDGRFEVVDDDPLKGLAIDGLLPDATCLAEDKQGGLWIGLKYSGVLRFADGELRLFNAYNTALPDSGIRDILVDRDNVKWFATVRGLLVSHDERRPVEQRWRTHDVEIPGRSSPDIFRCLRQHPDGTIWALCENGGLLRLDGDRFKLQYKPKTRAYSMDIDADGEFWIGTEDGLLRGPIDRLAPDEVFGNRGAAKVLDVCCERSVDAVYVATSSSLQVCRKERQRAGDQVSHEFLRAGRINHVRVDRRGRFILGYGNVGSSGTGASVYDGNAWRHFESTPMHRLWLADSLVDRAGKIWLLTRNGELSSPQGDQLVRELRRMDRSQMERTLDRQTPWRLQSLENLLKQPTVDATTDDVVNRPHRLYGKKIRIVGRTVGGFEWAAIHPADGTRIGTWPDGHSEFYRFAQDTGWYERLEKFEQRELVGYLEYGGYFGHLSGTSRQFFIVEEYPHGDEAAKAELQRDLTAWIEQHRAESRIWPEPHTERRIADLRALQGKWDLVSRFKQGALDDVPADMSWLFQWDRLTQETDLSRQGYQVTLAPERPQAAFVLQSTDENAGGMGRRGIYELQGDRLRVKFSIDLNTIPTSWETVDEYTEILTFRRDREYRVKLDRAQIERDPPDRHERILARSVAASIEYDAFGRVGGIRYQLMSGAPRLGPVRDDDLPPLEALKHLTRLNVGSGQITDAGLTSIGKLKSLEFLTVQSDRITDAGLGQLKSLPNLKTLFVFSSNVTGEFLGELTELPTLVSLDLSHTRLNDEALRHIAAMKQLRYLTLPSTCTDKGLAHLSELDALQELRLLGDVSDAGLANLHLERKQQLRVLILQGAGITDRGLEGLAGLSNLQDLELKGTKAGGKTLAGVSQCTRLHVLAIEPVEAGDDDLRPLGNLRSLFILSLTGDAEFSEAGLEHLAPLSALWRLKINGGGIDADCIGPLKKLSNLRQLIFTNHDPRDEALDELKSALPDVKIL